MNAAARPTRVLAVYRHPTPYRDPLMDRISEVPGLDLRVAYLAAGAPDAPWELQPMRHASVYPRAFLPFTLGPFPVALHPGLLLEMARWRPDCCVVSGWMDPSVLALTIACRIMRVPYILGSETPSETRLLRMPRWLRSFIVHSMVRGASAWLPTGSRARSYLVELGANEARCHFFPTTSDALKWHELSQRTRASEPGLRSRLGLPDDEVVLFVGRLIQPKAVEVLLAAWESVSASRPKAVLVIVGDGPEREKLERLAIAPRIRFEGFLQPREVAERMAAADLLVLPSRLETWGAVVGEAMACGLPVVVTDGVGSAPDLIGPGGPGEVVPIDSSAALAEAILRVLALPDRRDALARLALQRSLEWGHDLALRSFLRALGDAGLALPEVPRRLAGIGVLALARERGAPLP